MTPAAKNPPSRRARLSVEYDHSHDRHDESHQDDAYGATDDNPRRALFAHERSLMNFDIGMLPASLSARLTPVLADAERAGVYSMRVTNDPAVGFTAELVWPHGRLWSLEAGDFGYLLGHIAQAIAAGPYATTIAAIRAARSGDVSDMSLDDL